MTKRGMYQQDIPGGQGCLRRIVSWQRVIGQLSVVRDLRWLVDGLEAKYGLTTPATRS
jgi:hypothetical protein